MKPSSQALGRGGAHAAPRCPAVGRRGRGVSLVELLVSVTLGLLVVSLGLTQWVRHAATHRALSAEQRLAREINLALETIANDLRRAGYWGDAPAGTWLRSATPAPNPYATVTPATASDTAAFSYSLDAIENGTVDSREQFGLRLSQKGIDMRLGESGWQALTDRGSLEVTAFRVEAVTESISLAETCLQPCAAGATACPPSQQVRSLIVTLEARDPTQRGSLQRATRTVRLRNDVVAGHCAT